MALRSEASGGESSGSEAGSGCLQFGVRSYLHHFYEGCSSSVWERDREDREDRAFVLSQRSTLWWKVSLALGLLLLTAGVASLSVGYATPRRIESFGEGDLFFVDSEAASFNRRLHSSAGAGAALSCLGSALVVMGVVVWIVKKSNFKERLFHTTGGGDRGAALGSKWKIPGEVVTKAPGIEERIPVTLSQVESVQPTP